MNSITKYSFLSLAIITLFLACNKSGKTDHPVAATSFSIANAQAWFEHEIKTNYTQAIVPSGPNKYFNIPDWGNSVYEQGANHIGYWRIPLNSKDKISRTVTVYDKGKKQSQVLMPNPCLLIYQDSAQSTRMLVMQSIPNPSKKGERSRFAGEVKMYHWNGDFEVGFIYENGKKEKQITPTKSNRRRPGDPNARWEFMCREYIDCEFQAQCTGSNSGTFHVFMAYASVRSENSCYYPSDDPYASAWNVDPGAQWSCNGWNQTNTTPVNICEDVWIDDIPEPEPYIPDPTIDTEGYGVQTITNGFTNPCHRSVATSIVDYRAASEIVKMAKDIFGVSAKTNLIFRPQSDYFIAYPNVPWEANVAAKNGTTNVNGIINSSIFLNDSMLANASQEYIAATILHEILHGILGVTTGGNANYQHNQMATTYLDQATALLVDMYGLSQADAYALNVDGLRNTVLGSALFNSLGPAWNNIVATATGFRNGTKGIACP